MEEIYKAFFESYEVSNFGNVRKKLNTGEYKHIKGSIMNRGYKYIQLKRENKRTNFLIHHYVAKCFIGDRPDKYDIDHIDRNKLNNHVSNLRYCTHKENCYNADRIRIELPMDMENRREAYIKLYNEECRDKILERKRVYYQKNKKKLSIQNKEYSEKNKEKIKERNKVYCEKNKEKIRERKQIYNSKIVCCEICNKEMRQDGFSKHLKTKIHLQNTIK